MSKNELFHIGLSPEQGAKYAIIPGDPDRVEKIAMYLDNPQFLAQHREYTSWTGFLEGEKVIVISSGIGGPSAAICIEELKMAGVTATIRVGTCGGINLDVKSGDLVIPTASVRMEGTSREYTPIEYPAAADFSVVNALVTSCGDNPYHVGIVQSKDSFYGQHNPDSMPVKDTLNANWTALKKAGTLASEMECAAIFTVAGVRKIRAGAVLCCVWNQERKLAGICENDCLDTTKAIKTAISAMSKIIISDRKSGL